jgi:hypothetical protein
MAQRRMGASGVFEHRVETFWRTAIASDGACYSLRRNAITPLMTWRDCVGTRRPPACIERGAAVVETQHRWGRRQGCCWLACRWDHVRLAPADADDLLRSGREALALADWEGARSFFEQARGQEETSRRPPAGARGAREPRATRSEARAEWQDRHEPRRAARPRPPAS